MAKAAAAPKTAPAPTPIPKLPCIVCGAVATWTSCTADDEGGEHPTYACDEHLPAMLRRQYRGDILVTEMESEE